MVSFCLSLYPWAAFRRTKGGLKLHTLLDHDGYLPAFIAISPARESDIKKARSLCLPKGPWSSGFGIFRIGPAMQIPIRGLC